MLSPTLQAFSCFHPPSRCGKHRVITHQLSCYYTPLIVLSPTARFCDSLEIKALKALRHPVTLNLTHINTTKSARFAHLKMNWPHGQCSRFRIRPTNHIVMLTLSTASRFSATLRPCGVTAVARADVLEVSAPKECQLFVFQKNEVDSKRTNSEHFSTSPCRALFGADFRVWYEFQTQCKIVDQPIKPTYLIPSKEGSLIHRCEGLRLTSKAGLWFCGKPVSL